MPVVTLTTRRLLERLLAWDVQRVTKIAAAGHDCTVYRARQAMAEACLALPVEAWPKEVEQFYRSLLETTRTPTSPVLQRGIGPLRTPTPTLTAEDFPKFVAAAREIGALQRLAEVAPEQWHEERLR